MTDEPLERPPGKSARKREMQALKELAEGLAQLPDAGLAKIQDPDILESVSAVRNMARGGARKRQIQYTAKLLSRIDAAPLRALLDSSGDAARARELHRLEDWRERLLDGDREVMGEILARHPETDRRQLRLLAQSAIRERQQGEARARFRKLFQFLKSLGD